MLIPRIRTPGEMAELTRRAETIRRRPYSQFGSTAPAFEPETDEPLLVPHQTYYETRWMSETAERSGTAPRVHTAIGAPLERTWIEEIESRAQAIRPHGRGEMGNPGYQDEGYVAVPRRYVTELGIPAVPPQHEYVAVPRRYVTRLGAPAVPPVDGYVAVPRRVVTGLGNGPLPMEWNVGTAPASAEERQVLTGALNAINVFSQQQLPLPPINELVAAAAQFAATHFTPKLIGISRHPTRNYQSAAEFNEKLRWGIAFVRQMRAHPESYQAAYRARGDRWWDWVGTGSIGNSLPRQWW